MRDPFANYDAWKTACPPEPPEPPEQTFTYNEEDEVWEWTCEDGSSGTVYLLPEADEDALLEASYDDWLGQASAAAEEEYEREAEGMYEDWEEWGSK